MTVLRIFLYLICIISIGWSVLIFGGPPIIKRLILGYSDGALVASGITVSPSLDISISRFEFVYQDRISGQQFQGVSRATEIAWSIFGEKPFLEINLGPSVIEKYATIGGVNIHTPSFKQVDWQKIDVSTNIKNLTLNSSTKTESLRIEGVIDLGSAKFFDIKIRAENFSAADGRSIYTAGSIETNLNQLNFNSPVNEQIITSTFLLKDISVSEFGLTAPAGSLEVLPAENNRYFKMDLHDVELPEIGFIKYVNVDGLFNQSNALQELKMDLENGILFRNLSELEEASLKVNKLGDEKFNAIIEGSLKEFELSEGDNFIGTLPSSNFIINMQLDGVNSKIVSSAEISLNAKAGSEIFGAVEIAFRSEPLMKLACILWECEFVDFELGYKLHLDDEWLRGSGNCWKAVCDLSEMDYLVRTSNTANLIAILNQTNILSPLSSLYLYGLLSSGQKINAGHELTLQF